MLTPFLWDCLEAVFCGTVGMRTNSTDPAMAFLPARNYTVQFDLACHGRIAWTLHFIRRWLVVLAAMLSAIMVPAKSRYLHASVGNIDMLSSLTVEDTKNFLYELLEVREELRELTCSAMSPDPSLQIVIFGQQREMNQYYIPENQGLYKTSTQSDFKVTPNGLAIAIVEDRANFKTWRDLAFANYGVKILEQLQPRAPDWIFFGLTDFLAPVEYRSGLVRLGRPFFLNERGVHDAKAWPLEDLLAGRGKTEQNTGLFRSRAWVFWHTLLAEPTGLDRDRIHRLFEAIRRGAPGDAGTVKDTLGLTIPELENLTKHHDLQRKYPAFERHPAAESLLKDIVIAPASELEERVGLAIFSARCGVRLSEANRDMMQLATLHPESPRPMEALAILAEAAPVKNPNNIELFWRRAMELNTQNPYVHLMNLEERMSGRTLPENLQSAVPEKFADRLREMGDQCQQLNPGELKVYQWLALTEALAPAPHKNRLDLVESSKAQFVFSGTCLSLAVGRWRSGQLDEARRLLHEYLENKAMPGANRPVALKLLELMQEREANGARPAE